MEWILLNTYTHPMDAQTDILLLESEGIEYRMDNEQTISIDPLLSQAIGGAKLWVTDEDAERAVALLQESHTKRREDHPDEYLDSSTPDWATKFFRGMLIAAVILILLMALLAGGVL